MSTFKPCVMTGKNGRVGESHERCVHVLPVFKNMVKSRLLVNIFYRAAQDL